MKPQKPISASPVAIESRICVLRGHRIILDRDLAVLYGVPTSALNQGVKRNSARPWKQRFAYLGSGSVNWAKWPRAIARLRLTTLAFGGTH